MKHPDYPRISSKTDRHGKVRWRFMDGSRPLLPGEPHTPEFDAAYRAATEGRVVRTATVTRIPTAAHPRSLNAAWRLLRETAKWRALDPASQSLYSDVLENFLRQPVSDGMMVGDGPFQDFRPRHIAAALDSRSPSKAKLLRIMLKKLAKIAILHEWIEFDPTYGAELPENTSEGLRAWPPHVCAKYEAAHQLGTAARTAYELGRWLGARASDIAQIRWDQLVTKIIDGEAVEGFEFVQHKGRNRKGNFAKFHPVSPMLAEALAPLDRSTATVLTRTDGEPYRMSSLHAMMWKVWLPAAGIERPGENERGYSLHGLRKALGGMLADAEATAHQSRDVLGHRTLAEVERYARSRDQAKAATGGMRKVVKLVKG